MRLDELARHCGGRLMKGASVEVNSLSIDSRKVNKDVLFIACPGVTAASMDGYAFIDSALKLGCSTVVVGNERKIPDGFAGVIQTDNPRVFAAKAAEILYGTPSKKLKIVGVTGTNGKTTVSFLVAQMLVALGKKAAVFGTLGIGAPSAPTSTGYTTPEAEILSARLAGLVDEGYEYVCMEISSHALATARAEGVDFSVVAFTNLSQDHLDFHENMQDYLDAKLHLFRERLPDGGWAVVPENAKEVCDALALRSEVNVRIVGGKGALHVEKSEQNLQGMKVYLAEKNEYARVDAPLFGDFNVENLLLAAGIGRAFGFDLHEVAKGLSQAKPVPGRMQQISAEGPLVLVDFAHTPEALRLALLACRGGVTACGKLIVVFGAGGDRDPQKRPMMGKVASFLADEVWLTSDNPRSENAGKILQQIFAGCEGEAKIFFEEDRTKAIVKSIGNAHKHDVVLIAGKGDERFQTIGEKKIEFVDGDAAQKALLQRKKKNKKFTKNFLRKTFLHALIGSKVKDASWVCIDSRKVDEKALFFALKGERLDAHDFVDKTLLQKSAGSVLHHAVELGSEKVLLVEDTERALQDLAHAHLQRMPALRIALTGSNGKTTTKEMLTAILIHATGDAQKVTSTKGNFNNHIGVPLTAFDVESSHEFSVLEMGMNHFGEITRLAEIAAPHIGLIVNLGSAHAGNLGGKLGVARAKGELFTYLGSCDGICVACADDDVMMGLIPDELREKSVSFGMSEKADVRLLSVREAEADGQELTFLIAGKTYFTRLMLDGVHNAMNGAAAIATAMAAGVAADVAVAGLHFVQGAPGRLQRKKSKTGGLVLDDSYNANPDSMAAGIATLVKAAVNGVAVAALGEMLELGAGAKKAHYELGVLCAEAKLAQLFVCGVLGKDLVEGAKAAGFAEEKIFWAASSQDLAEIVLSAALADASWLVKGSRGSKMENIVAVLVADGEKEEK